MHTTSEPTPAPKRMRAKIKDAPNPPVVKVKKPRVRKTPELASPRATAQASPEELREMIATAAYYLAAERGFTPGHELEDWLAAERRVLES